MAVQPPAGMSYVIDRSDTIVEVGPTWAAFAHDNGGQQFAESTLGRSLWDFVSGPTPRQVYRDLLARVRQGHVARFAFRCDAPHCVRRMMMTMTCLDGGAVRFDTAIVATLLVQGLRSAEPPASNSRALVRMCSWCKRIATTDEWHEFEDGITRLGLFTPENRSLITHGICPSCADAIDRELRSAG